MKQQNQDTYLFSEPLTKKDALRSKNACKLETCISVALSQEEASDQKPTPDEQVIGKDVTTESEPKDRTLLSSTHNYSLNAQDKWEAFKQYAHLQPPVHRIKIPC